MRWNTACVVTGAPKENRTNLCKLIVKSVIRDYAADTVKLFIYDRNGLYESYYGKPNVTGIIRNTKDLNEIVDGLDREIKNRIKLFDGYDICQYNKQHSDDQASHIILIADDICHDFHCLDKNAFRLIGQEGRFCGIHMVLVSDTLDHDLISRDVSSNLGCRVSFCPIGIPGDYVRQIGIPVNMIRQIRDFADCCVSDGQIKLVHPFKADN